MEKIPTILKWLAHKLFLILLISTVWFFVPLLSFTTNLTDRAQIKGWLIESQTYDRIVNESLSFLERESSDSVADQTSTSPIDNQALLNAIKPALPASFIQSQGEILIDGVYDWLDGTTGSPEFSISLASQKDDINRRLKSEIINQVQSLEKCSTNEIPQNFDPLTAKCQPPGINADAVVDETMKEFNSQDSILTQDFSDEDLDLSNEVLINGPVAYDTMELAPILFWLTLTLLVLLVIITSKSWKNGLKESGGTILSAGVLLFITYFLLSRMSAAPGRYAINQDGSDSQSEAVRNIFEPLTKTATIDVANSGMMFSLIIASLGAVMLFVGWKLLQNRDDTEDEVPELLKDDGDENDIVDRVDKETKADKKRLLSRKPKKPRKDLIQ